MVIFCKSAGDTPNLPTIRNFPVKHKSKFIDIVEEIGPDYEFFGTLLLKDNNGNKIKIIEKSERGDVLRIVAEILRQWLKGKGRLPVTWHTLIQCMRKSNLNVLSDQMEHCQNKMRV